MATVPTDFVLKTWLGNVLKEFEWAELAKIEAALGHLEQQMATWRRDWERLEGLLVLDPSRPPAALPIQPTNDRRADESREGLGAGPGAARIGALT